MRSRFKGRASAATQNDLGRAFVGAAAASHHGERASRRKIDARCLGPTG